MNLDEHLHEGERRLAHIWKAMALRGVVAIAFAAVVLVWPGIGLATLIALVGAFALVTGFATVASALTVPMRPAHRAWVAFEGLVGLAAGVAVIVWPNLSAVGLLYAIAAWAVALGLIELGLAFVLPLSGGRSLLLLLSALVTGFFGVVMFARPGAGAIALLALIGAFALITGITQIACALELRRVAGQLERPFIHLKARPVAQ
ncbi:MAG TPA: DUF308 domain-containing protein [Gaiellaceae bacterium]|nr:DUF308 domain-containing protein [Gaiellaceae bacterium]